MNPSQTPRPAGDLPRRVPGSARPVDSHSGPGPVRRGGSLPRLTQISSLGSRRSSDTNPAADVAADVPAPPGPNGFRGALGVVGIIGLLSVGGVLLTLGLVGGDDDGGRDGAASVAVDSGGTGVIDGLGMVPAPSAKETGDGADDKAAGTEKATSPSPTSGAPSGGSPSPGDRAGAPGTDATGTSTTAPAAAPGVNVFSHASQRCVDIVGGQAVQGAKLMIWDCSPSASQQWTFTGGTMRAQGMCVQPAGGSTADGADLELAACDGGPAQRLTLNVRHDLAQAATGKCADVRDNGTANGTRLQLWACSGGDNQKWSTS